MNQPIVRDQDAGFLSLWSSSETGGKSDEDPFPADLRGRQETVLLAEDDANVREVLSVILREFGYRVVECSDGEDAVRKFEAGKEEIDLAILDIVMPKQTGKHVYEQIRKWKKQLPVIFMSGYDRDIVEHKGLIVDDLVFMSKPVMLRELLENIRKMLSLSQAFGAGPSPLMER